MVTSLQILFSEFFFYELQLNLSTDFTTRKSQFKMAATWDQKREFATSTELGEIQLTYKKRCLNTVLNHPQEHLQRNFLPQVLSNTSKLDRVSREFIPISEIHLLVCDLFSIRATSNLTHTWSQYPSLLVFKSASVTLYDFYKDPVSRTIPCTQTTNTSSRFRQQQYFEQPQGQHPQMQQASPQGIPQQPQVVYMQQSPGIPGQPGHPQTGIPMQQTGQPGQQAGVAAPGGAQGQRTYQNVTPLASLGRSPAPVDCPACGQRQMTRISFLAGNYTQYVDILPRV